MTSYICMSEIKLNTITIFIIKLTIIKPAGKVHLQIPTLLPQLSLDLKFTSILTAFI